MSSTRRPTRPAHAWTEDPNVIGGRDLQDPQRMSDMGRAARQRRYEAEYARVLGQ
jgi:hypothetical protein